MSKKIAIKLRLGQSLDQTLKREHPWVKDYRVLSKSLDARGANRGKRPVFLYHLEAIGSKEDFPDNSEEFQIVGPLKEKPIIIGAGPAGLFCALRFLEYGIPSIVLERGAPAGKRMLKIARFWRYGEFDQETNVCFGEGGAGLFSDGKLITRVKSPFIKYVMRKFVEFGAPEEVAYESNPHLGSNKIRKIISEISNRLVAGGSEIRYHARVDDLLFDSQKAAHGVVLESGEKLHSQHIILAAGHSAHEMYQVLNEKNVQMKAKDFAVGVRVEHPRSLIDRIQYGGFSTEKYREELGTARYRLSYHNKTTDRGTYSFCMCPGGYVLSSGTQADGIVVNGMSNYSRSSPWSNSALVVTVKSDQISGKKDGADVLKGLHYQREIEKKAYNLSVAKADGRNVPAIKIESFLKGESAQKKRLPKNSCPSGVFPAQFEDILPLGIIEHLKTALEDFDRKMNGFTSTNGILMAPETRTSAPVTLTRDKKTLESLSHSGLYPCGEGAGYAGGITSAAVDGVRVAESIVAKVRS